MSLRICIAALVGLATGLSAAPAGAVVGGEKITPEAVPWFAQVGNCGGTLVTPDRLLTAAHCVGGMSPSQVGKTVVGGQLRTITHVALHPGYHRRNGENYLDDVAIVALDQPVAGVAPVTLGESGAPARIVGLGRPFAPGTGHSEAEMYNGGGLKQATLRQLSDRECATAFAHNRPGTGERFNAARMRCAADVDGREPLSSGCFGDSGGPLVVGLDSAPVQVGVVSWGGDKCGADHSPSVFADAGRYRDFILDPDPVWAPTRSVSVRVTGTRSLKCSAAGREPGTTLTYTWKRRSHRGGMQVIGTGRTHRPTSSGRFFCFVTASNAGGELLAGVDEVLR
ncbi:serine protease [Solirubrobacter taibaiensis]|nr:serine protease [Solirubrobacter taibaiensis]